MSAISTSSLQQAPYCGAASYRRTYGDLPFRTWTNPDELFTVIDRDGSGQLSISELRRFFKKSPFDPARTEALFTLIDFDGSGEISRAEWREGFYRAGFDGTSIVGQSAEGFGLLVSLVKPSVATQRAMSDLHSNRPPLLIASPEERGITLFQLRMLWKHVGMRCHKECWMDVHGDPLHPNTITIYEVIRYVVKPCTFKEECSYVERCSDVVIKPTWTVLHWFGDTLHDLLVCLEQHTRDRGMSEEAASYWIAAFSLNQHESQTSPVRLDDASCHVIPRAITLSVGTLLVVDRAATVFRRLWILFEAYIGITTTVHGRPKLFDMYTPLTHMCKRRLPAPPFEIHAVGLTDGFAMIDKGAGPTGGGEAFNKAERERHFPRALLQIASRASAAAAHTSIEHDARAIHEVLTREGLADGTLDCTVRGRFALAALRKAFDESGELLQCCLDAVRCSPLTHLTASLTGSHGFDKDAANELALSIPDTVVALNIEFSQVVSEAADVFLDSLALVVGGESDFGPYTGRTPHLVSVRLVSDAITADGGYKFGRVCGQPPALTALDWGLPAPFDTRVASAIVSTRHSRPLSYFGEGRFVQLANGWALGVPGKQLTASDLILLLASATRGVPPSLTSLDLSKNNISEDGCRILQEMISTGQLPELKWINLSGNKALEYPAKASLLAAMRGGQANRLGCEFRMESDGVDGQFTIIPRELADT